jgi:ATP-dependent Clp protease ATP-binding subunit ClpB
VEERERGASGIRAIKEELEKLKIAADNAEATATSARAAEIHYGRIPMLQKDLEMKDQAPEDAAEVAPHPA